MKLLRYTLRGDGPSDAMLMPILRWLMEQHFPDVEFRAQFSGSSPHALEASIRFALECHPCDLLFIHRDAESQPAAFRREEIAKACPSQAGSYYIPVIPIRMSEAWLLIDEAAIRRAAGNPSGTMDLSLPLIRKIESLPDPKTVLHDALKSACNLHGRRLKYFRTRDRILIVAQTIADYSPLRHLSAFQELESNVQIFAGHFRSNTQD